MFPGKKTEVEHSNTAPDPDDLSIPLRPSLQAEQPRAVTPAVRSPIMPPRQTDLARLSDLAQHSEPPRRPSEPQPRQAGTDPRTLVVGGQITVSGKISSCDQLIVEGSVEANLTDCCHIEIAEGGLFKGSAMIEDAEIRGRFEGNLVARKRLLIKSTGRISGVIHYGQIEVECGGQIAGEIRAEPEPEGDLVGETTIASAAE